MQIKFSVYDFYIFSIENFILSLPICRYSVGILMTEVLKMVKSVKFIRIKGPREARPQRIRRKNLPMGAGFDSFWKFALVLAMLAIN